MLQSVSLDDHLGPATHPILPTTSREESTTSGAVSLDVDPKGSLQYNGPTSIYIPTQGPVSTSPSLPGNAGAEIWSNMRLAAAMGIDGHLIKQALSQFFINSYPQYMFIYREAFLADYFEDVHQSKYWSLPLVYAVCALGAAQSDRAEVREKTALFAKCAQEIVYTYELDRPRITTVQTLLCLAFHELGQGNSTQGWILSGMAFRMGQGLGYQQDPSRWLSLDHTITTQWDIQVRRRVFWGCYVADKYISLYLGRPVYMLESDAAVHPTIPLPDFPDDHNWFGLDDVTTAASSTASGIPGPLVTTLRLSITLGKIFQDIMSDLFAPSRLNSNPEAMIEKLGQANLRLSRWHTDIPDHIRWNRWSSSGDMAAHIAIIHLFFYSISLSLNRHFVLPSSGFPCNQASAAICAEAATSVVALVRQIRSAGDKSRMPLVGIYALVMAAISITHSIPEDTQRSETDPNLLYIYRVLQESAQHYKLAQEVGSRLASYLRKDQNSTAVPADPNIATTLRPQEQRQETSMAEPPTIDGVDFADASMDMSAAFTGLDADLNQMLDETGSYWGWFSLGNMGTDM
ncbi:Fungal specific transcription factor domain-containing protein 12 [Elsinoe fawcettii]|nr:Fungal specific transcription factor domain-containing protein 12 [Elsinoe fawcettii]